MLMSLLQEADGVEEWRVYAAKMKHTLPSRAPQRPIYLADAARRRLAGRAGHRHDLGYIV